METSNKVKSTNILMHKLLLAVCQHVFKILCNLLNRHSRLSREMYLHWRVIVRCIRSRKSSIFILRMWLGSLRGLWHQKEEWKTYSWPVLIKGVFLASRLLLICRWTLSLNSQGVTNINWALYLLNRLSTRLRKLRRKRRWLNQEWNQTYSQQISQKEILKTLLIQWERKMDLLWQCQ